MGIRQKLAVATWKPQKVRYYMVLPTSALPRICSLPTVLIYFNFSFVYAVFIGCGHDGQCDGRHDQRARLHCSEAGSASHSRIFPLCSFTYYFIGRRHQAHPYYSRRKGRRLICCRAFFVSSRLLFLHFMSTFRPFLMRMGALFWVALFLASRLTFPSSWPCQSPRSALPLISGDRSLLLRISATRQCVTCHHFH